MKKPNSSCIIVVLYVGFIASTYQQTLVCHTCCSFWILHSKNYYPSFKEGKDLRSIILPEETTKQTINKPTNQQTKKKPTKETILSHFLDTTYSSLLFWFFILLALSTSFLMIVMVIWAFIYRMSIQFYRMFLSLDYQV